MSALDLLRREARSIRGTADDYDGLLELIGDARLIYRPETERISHYFQAAVPQQFDAVVHFDKTEAVEPLDLSPGWEPAGELPETYPSGV